MASPKNHDAALLALRIAAGVIFVLHGYGKLFGHAPGMEMFTGMVAGLHFPAPAFFAYCAAISEFAGGLALILGVVPRLAAAALSVVMLVAIVGVKKFALPMADVDVALLAIAVAVMFSGAGRYSITGMFSRKGETVMARN